MKTAETIQGLLQIWIRFVRQRFDPTLETNYSRGKLLAEIRYVKPDAIKSQAKTMPKSAI